MMTIHCSVKLPDTNQMLAKRNLEKGGLVQMVIDKAVIDYSIPYCPFDTGVLANSPYGAYAHNADTFGSGKVVYNTPYARYLYYGRVYGPNIPVFDDDSGVPTRWFSPKGQKKHPTGKDLQYKTDQNPLAGPFWVERMKADHKQDILEEAKHAAGIR